MASVFRRIIKSQSILNNGDVDPNYSVNNISVAFNVCLNVKLLSLSWIHLKILIAFAIGFEHVSITIIKQINTTSLLKYQYIESLFLLLHCLMNKILNIIPFMCKNNNQIMQDIFNGLNSINKQILFASQYSLNIDPNEMNKPNECKTNFLFAVMIDKNINICQIIYRVFHMISSDVSSIDINDASVESNESQSVFNVNHDDGINVYKSHHYIHNKYIPLVISIYDIIYKLNNNIFNIIFRPSKTHTTRPTTTHQGGGYGVGDDNNGQVEPNGVAFNDKEMMSTNNTNYSPLYYVISALLISICCISDLILKLISNGNLILYMVENKYKNKPFIELWMTFNFTGESVTQFIFENGIIKVIEHQHLNIPSWELITLWNSTNDNNNNNNDIILITFVINTSHKMKYYIVWYELWNGNGISNINNIIMFEC